MSLYPHQKLDWNLARLERHLDEHGDDAGARLEYATALWSKAQFHDGGEALYNRALTQARRVLQHDAGAAAAHVLAGASLVGLDRLDAGRQHLDEGARIDAERADVHYARGLWHQAARKLGDPQGDRHQAVREAEMACRLAPDAWEPHALLAALLWERGQELGGPERARRLVERSQYHAVRTLSLEPATESRPGLLYHLGILCLHGGKYAEANKLFTELLEVESFRAKAQYYLGLVNFQLGKYKNAILYLRQHLDSAPEAARVHAKIGMAYLHLGEVVKAREASNKALAIDPADVQARFTLGCALVEEGRDDEALKTFKGILEDAPGHAAAFGELVRMRTRRGDSSWLRGALRAEAKGFDRLPTGPPRDTTRERISVVIDALRSSDGDAATAILEAVDLTTDESLRFQLWEAALDDLSARRAKELGKRLEEPGRNYSARAGREALILARALPEPLLTKGLQIEDEDLRRAAVDRHGPARDVNDHRRHVDHERREARAWQALLLLAVASHGNRSSRSLLVRWASEADPDLADAANAALAMLGDADATEALRKRARARGVGNLVDAMVAQVLAPEARVPVRPLADGEDRACTTCGRRPKGQGGILLVGARAAICSVCLADLAAHRRELETDDPEKVCAMSGAGTFETAAMYVYRGTPICREVVDQGLGLLEREEVDRYLATL